MQRNLLFLSQGLAQVHIWERSSYADFPLNIVCAVNLSPLFANLILFMCPKMDPQTIPIGRNYC